MNETIDVLEIVELNYNYVVVKTKTTDIRPRLRYTIPLIISILPGLEPFVFNISGVVKQFYWDDESETCTFTLANLDLEKLYEIDSWEVYEEIVSRWNEQKNQKIGEHEESIVIYSSSKYTKYKKIKERMDLIRLLFQRRKR